MHNGTVQQVQIYLHLQKQQNQINKLSLKVHNSKLLLI